MERHVAPSALARLFSGQASEPEAALAVPHLVRCRRCWDQAARLAGELRREGALTPGTAAAGAVLLLIEEEDSQALRRLRALGGWAKLRRLSAKQQLDRIKADPALQTLEMFATLAEAATCTSREDPYLGEETALVAHALAAALPEGQYPAPFRNDLQGEALSIVANCRRLAGDLQQSAAAFGQARGHLRHGTGEPAREARLLSLQASLATDTGRIEQALELLARAAALYTAAQEPAAVASVTVQEAYILLFACRYEEAITRAEAALRWLALGESRLTMLARSIVTESLVSLGRPLEALRSFLATQPLFKKLWGRKNELISGYLEALLLDALGHAREADKAFRNNIAKTLEAELYKDAFRTMLTHFECLFRRGALDKAARVCEEAIERIEQAGTGCHAQMTELWRDLLTLVEARRLTEHQVLAARQYLVRHWNAPASHAPLARSGSFSVSFREKPGPAARPETQGWHAPARPAATAPDLPLLGYEEALERYDRELVAEGLAESGGSVRETSRLLGISRNTLRAKIRKYGLAAEETPEPAAEPGPLGEDEATRAVTWLRTRTWWRELKTLPHGQQLARLQTVSSLQTREMFDIMIDEAAIVALEDPLRGQETAQLAHTLAGLLPRSGCPEPVRHDLQGEALRIVANCRRLVGDWQGCAATLAAARLQLDQGSGELAREARYLSIEASLAADTGHEEQALALLARVTLLYRRMQDPASLASVMVQEASALLSAGRHEEAIARAEEALRCLPPGEGRLALLARNIVTESLVFLERPGEARRSLFATQPLYEQHRGPRTELQWGYLVALLLGAQGLDQESEKVYQDNVEGLMEAGLFKNAFWSLLTQFESMFRRGALDQAARTCEEALSRIEEAGMAGHGPMTELWRNLLSLVQARRLKESDVRDGLQSLVHSGNDPENCAPPGDDRPPVPSTAESQAPEAATPGSRLAFLAPPDPATSLAEGGYKQALERYDRQLVAATLAQAQGRIAETSRLLGIPRNSLHAKLKRYFLTGDED